MNFLAHIYLSGNNDLLKIGNFMADSIRGNSYENYPEEIKKGILLHRSIDSFTDMHPVYRKSKHRLHEKYGHYSGVIMDIFYDHFLAKNWANCSRRSTCHKLNRPVQKPNNATRPEYFFVNSISQKKAL